MIEGCPVTVLCDHKNVLQLMKAVAPKVVRWRLMLQQFNYRVLHVEGKDSRHAVADCLSRLHGPPPKLALSAAAITRAQSSVARNANAQPTANDPARLTAAAWPRGVEADAQPSAKGQAWLNAEAQPKVSAALTHGAGIPAGATPMGPGCARHCDAAGIPMMEATLATVNPSAPTTRLEVPAGGTPRGPGCVRHCEAAGIPVTEATSASYGCPQCPYHPVGGTGWGDF